MRHQTKERYSSPALERFTRFSTMQVENNHINPETVERLARELADARMVIECARHLSVLVRPPEAHGLDRHGRGVKSLRDRIDEAWEDLDEALHDYYGGPRPVVDGETDP